MAMFKMNPMFSGDPELCVVAGSVVFTNTSAIANNIVQSALFKASANAAGAAIGQNETVAPQGSKVTVVQQPTTAYHPAVITNANTGTVLLDLRAYPGDIVCVNASVCSAPNATPGQLTLSYYDAALLGIDQTNNFVYLEMVNASGTAQPAINNIALHYVVFFKDSFAS